MKGEVTMLFQPGHIVATPGALQMGEAGIDLSTYLKRHLNGDWGDLDDHDKGENEQSLDCGYRLLSAYSTPQGKLWILTEADRSVTTFLLPSEY